MYIVYVLLYALLIGIYSVFKKLSRNNSASAVVLAIFSSVYFLLSLLLIPNGVGVSLQSLFPIAIKGFLIAISWYLTLCVIKNADLSLVTATNVLSTIITFIVGFLIFNESMSIWQIVGSIVIVSGVVLINYLSKSSGSKNSFKIFLLLLVVAIISATSSGIDRYTTLSLSRSQVQFWFGFFVCLSSWIIFIFEKIRTKDISITKNDLKNIWIYLTGIFLFVGDFMLFLSYKQPNSQMIVISILSKLKIIVATIFGIAIFKERNVTKKILLMVLIILGAILVSVCG